MAICRAITVLLLLVTLPAGAAYKWTKPDGTVVFSDEPPHPDAEEIKLKLTPTVPAEKIPLPPPKKSAPGPAATRYTRLTITTPEDDTTVFDNEGNVTVTITSEPALNSDQEHKVVIELDGETTEPATDYEVTLAQVDRGTHTIRAHILDAAGKTVISSDSVTFHLKRFSRLHRAR